MTAAENFPSNLPFINLCKPPLNAVHKALFPDISEDFHQQTGISEISIQGCTVVDSVML